MAERERFLARYRAVRERDGYRRTDARYYRDLPEVADGDPQASVWLIRRQTYRGLLRFLESGSVHAGVGQPQARAGDGERDTVRPARVLDLGAGSGWLSHRLSSLGHDCVAVDLLDDDADGLGAARHYDTTFARVRADFEQLPFSPGRFDLVVFNASLHYSSDIGATLRGARAMLARGGAIAVMDSPLFAHDADGWRMLADVARPDGPGVGYVTREVLARAADELGLTARFVPSRGSLRWALGRAIAGLKERRRPAAFGLWIGISR